VLKGYKIHQEQIENVARTLKEFTQPRRPGYLMAGRPVKRKQRLISRTTGNAGCLQRNIVWETGAAKGPVTDLQIDPIPGTEAPVLTGPVLWCRRCGEGFPVMDFLYTGLCISCWEAKVV
jgi:hypothetical protein